MSALSTEQRSLWWTITAFVVTNVCAVIAWVYLFVLNRVRIVRPYRGDDLPNLMFVSNHQSPVDSFLIALAAFFPRALINPRLHPWNFAASEHFFSNPVIAWLSNHLRCIAVRTGGDAGALRTMCRVLPKGVTVLFPEGQRSPDGIRPGLPGAGFVARQTQARIIPVAIDGLLDTMPYHAPRPHIGKRITIAFGDPLSYDDLLAAPATRETAQEIVDRSMAAVNHLHKQLSAATTERPISIDRDARSPTSRTRRRKETFRNKVVWITGASSGIGRALALAAHQQAATLILSARDVQRLESVARECTGAADVHVLPLDLTQRETLADKVRTALGIAGQVDYVIHNAGIAARDLTLNTCLEVDRQVMETNYFGPVALTKSLLPSMLSRRSGCFVIVSSVTGKYGVPLLAAYSASKHALHGFFESLRSEVRESNIQVTIAVPGFVNTPITLNALTGTGARFGKRMAVHLRGMDADQCASRILQGVAAQKDEFLVGGLEIFTVRLLRISRRLVAALVGNHPFQFKERLLKHFRFIRNHVNEAEHRMKEETDERALERYLQDKSRFQSAVPATDDR